MTEEQGEKIIELLEDIRGFIDTTYEQKGVGIPVLVVNNAGQPVKVE